MSNFKNRVGEEGINSQGLKMVIISYRSSRDIDVQFEDGFIKKGVRYAYFKKGCVKHKEIKYNIESLKRLGEVRKNKTGLDMKIVSYRSSFDIDVEFKNGSIVTTSYGNFVRGSVGLEGEKYGSFKGRSRIGEISLLDDGTAVKLLNYRSSTDIDVVCKDGLILKGVKYSDFKKGKLSKKAKKQRKVTMIGEKGVNNQGLIMEIKNYKNNKDIDVVFEDGTLIKGIAYSRFIRGGVRNPNFSKNLKIPNNQTSGGTL